MEAERGEHTQSDGALIRRVGDTQHQRGFERLTLWARKPRQKCLAVGEQIAQAGVGERHLLFGSPAAENRVRPRFGRQDRFVPHRRLADAGLADDRERGETMIRAGDERLDLRELATAPEHPSAGHPTSLGGSSRRA